MSVQICDLANANLCGEQREPQSATLHQKQKPPNGWLLLLVKRGRKEKKYINVRSELQSAAKKASPVGEVFLSFLFVAVLAVLEIIEHLGVIGDAVFIVIVFDSGLDGLLGQH